MNIVARYDIACQCGETISLLEKSLRRIVENLQESDRDNPQITFLCLRCNTASRYDYLNRTPAAMIDALPETPEPKICTVLTGCGNRRCDSPVELVVVEKSETSDEQFEQQVHAFDRTKVFCENCHEPFPAKTGIVRFL